MTILKKKLKYIFNNINSKRLLSGFVFLVFLFTGVISLTNTYKVDGAQAIPKEIPVLMYHNIDKMPGKPFCVSIKQFEKQIVSLLDAGYTPISVKQAVDYVYSGTELPQKPVIITFDDGYLSNYELAYPILKKYNVKATIFVIGVSVGKDTYKDTQYKIIPHFNYEQAKEMADSGLVEIECHTYDMHQWADYENGPARLNILPLEGESKQSYINALTADITRAKDEILLGVGKKTISFAYPGGRYNETSMAEIMNLGFKAIFTTNTGMNYVVKGRPESLYNMKRYTISEDIKPEMLIEFIKQ